MISITNTQRKFAIDEKQLQRQAAAMLTYLAYADFDLGILICGTTTMRTYNRNYRGKDKVTDVLSFPFDDNRDPAQKIIPANDDEKNLGDIIICPQYLADTCHKWNRDFTTHLTALLAHGIAHLLGHDHITDEDFARMAPVEKALIETTKDIA